MAQYAFGSGAAWGTNSAANSTPKRFGATQGIEIDFKASNKALFGSYRLPLAVGGGPITVSGKIAHAQLDAHLMNDLFFNGTLSTGQVVTQEGESGTVGATPYQITVANSATFTLDLGVIYAATGLPLTKVAATPTQGQYSVAAGVYTFAAADTGVAMKLNYLYTATGGQKIVLGNSLMGSAPSFQSTSYWLFNNQKSLVQLNNCVGDNYGMKSTVEDFMKPDFGFQAFVDSSNTLGTISLAEVD